MSSFSLFLEGFRAGSIIVMCKKEHKTTNANIDMGIIFVDSVLTFGIVTMSVPSTETDPVIVVNWCCAKCVCVCVFFVFVKLLTYDES